MEREVSVQTDPADQQNSMRELATFAAPADAAHMRNREKEKEENFLEQRKTADNIYIRCCVGNQQHILAPTLRARQQKETFFLHFVRRRAISSFSHLFATMLRRDVMQTTHISRPLISCCFFEQFMLFTVVVSE